MLRWVLIVSVWPLGGKRLLGDGGSKISEEAEEELVQEDLEILGSYVDCQLETSRICWLHNGV